MIRKGKRRIKKAKRVIKLTDDEIKWFIKSVICKEIKVNTFRDVLLVCCQREKRDNCKTIKLIFFTIDETQKENRRHNDHF